MFKNFIKLKKVKKVIYKKNLFKSTNDLNDNRSKTFRTVTRLVPSPFLFSKTWLLYLNDAFQNGFVFSCSTACLTAAKTKEMTEYGNVR